MHFKTLLFTLVFAVAFQTPDGAVPQQAKPNITEFRTSMEISQKTTLSQAFVAVLHNTGLAGGIVNKEGCELPAREFYVPQGMQLSQALDHLAVSDAHHRWVIAARAIVFIPTGGAPVLLQTRIPDLTIKDTNNLTLAVDQITQTTAMRNMISALRLTVRSPEPGFSKSLAPGMSGPEPSPLSLHDVSLLDALNMIAAQHGGAIWSYDELDCAGKKQLRLDFIGR